MIKNNFLVLMITAALLIILSGCFSLNRSAAEKKLYSLEAGNNIAEISAETLMPILVKEFEIAPMYTTNSFVYRMGEFRFKTDYYNEFIITPQRMITEAVQQALYDTKLFCPSSPDAPAVYRLSGRVVKLHGDFRNPDHPLAVMEILINLDTTDKNNLNDSVYKSFSRTFYRKSPIKDQNPDALVMGFNNLLTEIVKDFIDEVTKI